MRRLTLALVALGACSTPPPPPPAAPTVAVVDAPPTTGTNPHYAGYRPPLVPAPLIKLPVGTIAPRGWLRSQLLLQTRGFSGRLSEISRFLKPEGHSWLDPDSASPNDGEELPYWLKGFGDLGYVLKDDRIVQEARKWIEAIIAGQRADGYFGPRDNLRSRYYEKRPDLWPNITVLSALRSFYEATGDERILTFLTRYFRWQLDQPRRLFLQESWQQVRACDNLEAVHWLYNRTGEPWLLDLGKAIHEQSSRWDERLASWHGVNICQGFREPAVYYMQSNDRRHLDAADRNYQEIMSLYGQMPGGMFAADEYCRPGYDDPRQAAESCSMSEFMRSHEMLLMFTGSPLHADRCEEIAFNSFPAALTPDLKALHYLTAPNMVQLDAGSKSPGLQNPGAQLSYDSTSYRCCVHNVGMTWPYYAEHLWFATRDCGLAAGLYAASEVKAKVADGVEVTISEETDYPFDEAITLTVSTPRPAAFPLYVRIPRWCDGARLSINGTPVEVDAKPLTYVRLDRTWSAGDRLRIDLPMKISTRTWVRNRNAVSVDRGPLTFSLKIGERWVRNGGTDEWPAWEVYPTTPWNYGLSSLRFEAVRKPLPDQPFAVEGAPIELIGTGRRIPDWRLDQTGLVPTLPVSPLRSAEPDETIRLVPMGCARLRISAFPVIGE